MKLSNNDKNELRQKIVERLQSVPDGQRIHLDKDLLEDLLFNELVCNKENGETVKLPVWSGEFLRKIDLSEVSFDNVSWYFCTDGYEGYMLYYEKQIIDKEFCDLIEAKYFLRNNDMVDYSYTNAKIDFSKSWEARHGEIRIASCNFAGVDLSNNNGIRNIEEIYICDLSNTKLKLTLDNFSKENKNGDSIISRTNLSSVDLSEITQDAISMIDCGDYNGGVGGIVDDLCDLSNTGFNVILNPKVFKEQTIHRSKDDGSVLTQNMLEEIFSRMIESGRLDGCYINGKLIKSKEERQAFAQEIIEEYEKMKDDIFDSVIGSIDEQVGHIKR